MKALFLTNLELNENEGIYKKINAEATAIGNTIGQCELLMREKNGTIVKNTKNGKKRIVEKDVLEVANDILINKDIDLIYIRIMVPNFKLIALMSESKKRKTKIFYEIPTYPYYAEQFKASRRKYRSAFKIFVDVMFSPFIKKYADHIVVVKSNNRMRLHKKMIEISNGADINEIRTKRSHKTSSDTFKMVTVGTLFPYHGYDRILTGMKKCNEIAYNHKVELHVIGKSKTIDDLKVLAQKLELKNVYFHGVKTAEELNVLFEEFDVGLGCLALHRRNANIDTTLKIIDYYCRGIPVITSGISPYKDSRATIKIPDSESPVDVQYIYNQWINIDVDVLYNLSENAKKRFDWNVIMKELFQSTDLIGG